MTSQQMTTSPPAAGGPAPGAAPSAYTAPHPGKPKPKALYQRMRQLRLGATTVLALLACWEAATRWGLLPPEVSPVTEIVVWFADSVTTAAFWIAVRHTMTQWAFGVTFGVGAGVVVGFGVTMVSFLERMLRLVLEFVRPIPSIVYLPLMLLLFGATDTTAVMIITLGVFFPMLYQTMYGLKGVDPVTVDTARVFGLSALQRIRYVTLPSALPSIATGIRLAVAVALIVAMAVQLTAGVSGLGSRLAVYQSNGVYAGIYGVVATSGFIGLAVVGAFERIERVILKWHESHRPASTS